MNQQPLLQRLLQRFRHQLANVDALPQLAILGFIAGLFTGIVIVLFRAAVEIPLSLFLPFQDHENFEGISPLWRSILPCLGVIALIVLFSRLATQHRKVGVAHVIERLNFHQGHLPWKNFFSQFFGGVIALMSGQSCGREGPAVHLGAAGSSLLGQWLKLPNNSIRTLVGCGSAAAIAAGFNTPMAGVIFAMEVIMMEYTIVGFTPVIIASVTAAVVSQLVYGAEPAFIVPQLQMGSLTELPLMILEAVVIGSLAAAFIWLVRFFYQLKFSWWQKMLTIGFTTGIVSIYIPEVLGIGYDTVNEILVGNLSWQLLLLLLPCKLIVTAAACGAGIPGGIIGPSLLIGATFGALTGLASFTLFPTNTASEGFYAMLGMGAMMGAVLQAPLAALIAVLELTQNPNIILPAMLVIVVANLTSSEIFKQPSIFTALLKAQGLDPTSDPLSQALRRIGVASMMDRRFIRLPRQCNYDDACQALESQPMWVVIDEKQPVAILLAADLARYLEAKRLSKSDETENPDDNDALLDLLALPGQRKDIMPLYIQATLQEAREKLKQTGVEALYIQNVGAPLISPINGILTKEDIERYYHLKK
ncbi:chloride channel protein [Endozoicomonas sp. SM1973]|uniref:Chloride channel protein n=1 Tax=Spartinivicinus marinus TaxID=2994442 RepID=A0A853I6F0_9GAMM|nr:chloride channel protein [Spartinivicinus marinus]MCX4028045.1 chloride channel protein [Spartinivicinus marinus]NYZ68329.1 chloride channel protein [Spartinivicinus marinus]